MVRESEEFLRLSGKKKTDEDSYSDLLQHLLPVFKETVGALGAQGAGLGPDLTQLSSAKSPAGLEKAHRAFLTKLEVAAK